MAAVQTHGIEAIIPTSEEVFWLAGAAPYLPATVTVRTSPLALLAQLHHKGTFASLATRLGFGAPAQCELKSERDVAALQNPAQLVVKPCYSRFGSRILISPTARELRQLRPTATEPWLAQTRVRGREFCLYNVAASGKLLLHVAYEPAIRLGVGASLYFQPVINDALRAVSERFIAATGFTGQISFDVIETETGWVALECNPRGTSGVHLAAQQPEVLAGALLGSLSEPAAAFTAQPRMLWLPFLLSHARVLLTEKGRRQARAAQDALRAAGIPRRAQLRAFVEILWRATRAGMSPTRASTLDFEWNGEPIVYG
jgi:hypothetical protein